MPMSGTPNCHTIRNTATAPTERTLPNHAARGAGDGTSGAMAKSTSEDMRVRLVTRDVALEPCDATANARAQLDEARLGQHAGIARPREIHFHDLVNASRARRHDDHAVREQHRFADAVRDEEDGIAARPPDLLQLETHSLARHHV